MGWLKIDRDIQSHWIWNDPVKFQWWIDILITVNFEDKKTSIGFKVFECKRGESLISLLSWSKKWKVSKSVVNAFFKMLEKNNMVVVKNETVTTRLTVCNYDSYQLFENAKKTRGKRLTNAKKTQGDPTKEGEEGKEFKEGKENIVVGGWRYNFDTYISDLRIEYLKLKFDSVWIQEKQKYYPKLNILLTLEKVCVEFWSTKEGWEHKKKTKSIDLDWKSTLTKSLSQTQNKVYADSNFQSESTQRKEAAANLGKM